MPVRGSDVIELLPGGLVSSGGALGGGGWWSCCTVVADGSWLPDGVVGVMSMRGEDVAGVLSVGFVPWRR
jgi:hypothetical protein